MRKKLLILAALGCLAGCKNIPDPSYRAGTWKPEHVNDANLEAMVANPADLQRGHGDGAAIGATAAVAIERLRSGKVKDLPTSGVLQLTPVPTGAAPGGGGQ